MCSESYGTDQIYHHLPYKLGGLLIILAWSTDHLTEQSIRVKWPYKSLGGLLIILAWSTDHLTEQSIRVKWPLPAFFWVITIIAGRSGYPHLRLHLIVIFAHRGKCLLCNNYE